MRTVAILSFNSLTLVYLALVFLVWTRRVFWMRSFRKSQPPLIPIAPSGTLPKISVIVPARNEEKNIERCLQYLLAQNYPDYEIIVADDRSSDATPRILERYQTLSKIPLKVIRIEKLPESWTGKNYAVFTASKAARGEWLLFTDADTSHRTLSLSTAMSVCLDRKIDFLTLAPEVESKSFWEKTVQPLAVSSLALWFDPRKVNDPKNPSILANGQYIFIRKEVYEKSGGNEAVKDQVVEDVEFAKKVKSAGYHVQFLDGTTLYATRMYTSLKEIRTGWTRILTYLFNKNIPAILHKIFLFLFFSILPFAAIFAEGAFWWGLLVCGWIIFIRFMGNRIVKSNPWYAFLHVLGSLVMVWILLNCVARILFKRKSVWKGQSYS